METFYINCGFLSFNVLHYFFEQVLVPTQYDSPFNSTRFVTSTQYEANVCHSGLVFECESNFQHFGHTENRILQKTVALLPKTFATYANFLDRCQVFRGSFFDSSDSNWYIFRVIPFMNLYC